MAAAAGGVRDNRNWAGAGYQLVAPDRARPRAPGFPFMIAAGSLGGVRFGLPRRWRRTLGAAPSRLRRYTSGGRRDRRLPSSPFVVARIGHGRYSALRSRTRRPPLIIVTSPSPTSPTRRLSRSSTPARISSTLIGRPPPVCRQPDSGQAEGSRATGPAEWTSSEGKPPQTAKEQPSWTCAESLLVNVRWDGVQVLQLVLDCAEAEWM